MSCHGVETLVKRSWDTDIDNDECPQPVGRTMTMRRQKHKEHKSAALPIYRVRYHRAHPPQCLLTTSPLMRSEEDKKPGREISRPRNHRSSTHRTSIQRRSRARSPLAVQEESSPLVDSPSLPLKSEKSYRLEIVQHPIKCAEFGTSPLTRLPLSPPVIVQLHLRGGGEIEDEVELPFLVAQLALYSADGNNAVDHPHPHPQARTPHPNNTNTTTSEWGMPYHWTSTRSADVVWQFGRVAPVFEELSGKAGGVFFVPGCECEVEGAVSVGGVVVENTRVGDFGDFGTDTTRSSTWKFGKCTRESSDVSL
ncbi:hypothetical protein QCA50_009194 [Cerrena zonata]|uniref:Velvet domain-containing protein n=1 Tax=Cerrena zonata TaxID=2478898 RepID=A0AAW0G3A6_9APHY